MSLRKIIIQPQPSVTMSQYESRPPARVVVCMHLLVRSVHVEHTVNSCLLFEVHYPFRLPGSGYYSSIWLSQLHQRHLACAGAGEEGL